MKRYAAWAGPSPSGGAYINGNGGVGSCAERAARQPAKPANAMAAATKGSSQTLGPKTGS